MKLTVFFPTQDSLGDTESDGFTVSSEADILKLGFAAARAVRAWVRKMPFVPSVYDLQFPIRAEVEAEPAGKVHEQDTIDVPAPKRKRKAKK